MLGGRAAERDTREARSEVRVADTLEIRRGLTQDGRGCWPRREAGSAEVAVGLYDETPESVAAREQRAPERRLARPSSGSRRPADEA